MGVVVAPVDAQSSKDVVVQWWVPPLAREQGARGRGKHVVDLARAMVATINKGDAMPSIKGAWE